MSTSNIPAIEIRALDAGYLRKQVLHSVNLEIQSGQYWVFLGPNGSGKSTLLSTILGLQPPLAGKIRRHADFSPAHTGYVPQRGSISTALPVSVREFVALGMAGPRLSRAQREERLAWALSCTGLGELAKADGRRLSGGQRQRMLLARALVRKPRLLILDEPTEGLDIETRQALLSLLSHLRREEGLTIIMATHDLETAASEATHAAVFSAGKLRAGPAAEIISSNPRPEKKP